MTLRSCERADAHACIGVCGPVNGAPITPRLPVHLVAAGFDVGGGEFVDARSSIPTTSLPRTALSAWQDEGVWRRDGLDLGRKTRKVLHVEGEHGIRAQALGDDEEDPFRGVCLDQRVEDVIRDRGLEPLRERHAAQDTLRLSVGVDGPDDLDIPAVRGISRLLKKQPARARTARRNHRGFEKAE